MANGINKAIIVGRLGQDPDVKYMPSGTAVANLSVATSEQWKDKQTGEKQEKTEWHKVTLFARLAEVAGEYLAKGSLVYIEGRIQTDKWTDKDGIDRYTTKIIGNNMQMLGSKNSASTGAQKPADSEKSGAPQYETGFDDDIPFAHAWLLPAAGIIASTVYSSLPAGVLV